MDSPFDALQVLATQQVALTPHLRHVEIYTMRGIQLVQGAGAQRVVVMGHSFGGAVAVRVGVGLDGLVAGVVTFATQSAGCEHAAGLRGRPLLLFHGERDEILPVEASEMVRTLAGDGELVRLPGDGHLLAKSGDVLWERLETWLPPVLGLVR